MFGSQLNSCHFTGRVLRWPVVGRAVVRLLLAVQARGVVEGELVEIVDHVPCRVAGPLVTVARHLEPGHPVRVSAAYSSASQSFEVCELELFRDLRGWTDGSLVHPDETPPGSGAVQRSRRRSWRPASRVRERSHR